MGFSAMFLLLECFTHVQYSRLDSSGQNLESNGVWSKNETGSTVLDNPRVLMLVHQEIFNYNIPGHNLLDTR